MPAIPEVFKLTWKLQGFNPRMFALDIPVESGPFRIECLEDTKWNLKLLRTVIEEEDWITFVLCNESGENSYSVSLEYWLEIIVEGRLSFSKHGSSIDSTRYLIFIPFVRTHSSINKNYSKGNLIVVCRLNRHHLGAGSIEALESSSTVMDLESLSKDITELYLGKLYSDLTLSTDDHQTFKVHKFVISSRWQESILKTYPSENQFTVNGVTGSVLDCFLRYLYSGKLIGKEVTVALYDFAFNSCMNLRRVMRTPPNELSIHSRFNTERIVVKWCFGGLCSSNINCMPLHRVVPLNVVYSPELWISVDFVELNSASEHYLGVTFGFSHFEPAQPISLHCHMLLEGSVKQKEVMWSANTHVFLRDEHWNFPPFIKKSDLASSFQLILTLDIVDSMLPRIVNDSCVEFRTASRTIYNLRSLSRDMYFGSRDMTFSDVKITTKSRNLFSHRAILSTRSKVFRDLLQVSVEIVGDLRFLNLSYVDFEVMTKMLTYIYTGTIDDLSREDVPELMSLSEMFHMDRLHKLCVEFLN